MIYITGDTHGGIDRFYESGFLGESKLTENDYVIVCGDFGFLFYPEFRQEYHMQQNELDELENKPYTILFCDGNHENFPLIYSYPVENWQGGRVHRIRKNVLHLMRGQVFDLDGKKIFVMGGAYSIDKYMRREGLSWWPEELPSNQEYREATQNLKECGNEIDIIVSHTAPREIIRRMGKFPDTHDGELTGFLEWIMYEVKFKKWFFGHWHMDKDVTDKFRAIYFDIIPLKEIEK